MPRFPLDSCASYYVMYSGSMRKNEGCKLRDAGDDDDDGGHVGGVHIDINVSVCCVGVQGKGGSVEAE